MGAGRGQQEWQEFEQVRQQQRPIAQRAGDSNSGGGGGGGRSGRARDGLSDVLRQPSLLSCPDSVRTQRARL